MGHHLGYLQDTRLYIDILMHISFVLFVRFKGSEFKRVSSAHLQLISSVKLCSKLSNLKRVLHQRERERQGETGQLQLDTSGRHCSVFRHKLYLIDTAHVSAAVTVPCKFAFAYTQRADAAVSLLEQRERHHHAKPKYKKKVCKEEKRK